MNRNKFFIFFLLLFIVSVSAWLFYSASINQNSNRYDRIAKQYTSTATQQNEEKNILAMEDIVTADNRVAEDTAAEEPSGMQVDAINETVIDFEGLWEINPDIYAWVSIPGTEIEYPIVQSSEDDAYYLSHTVERKSGLPGSIYTEQQNSKDFTDLNTVIYGHNMKNGSMFAGLHQYKNPDFMNDNQRIYIYTPEHTFIYEIFAGVTYGNTHILKTFDFQDMVSYQDFLDTLYNVRTMGSYVDEEIKLTLKTPLITLSTCTKSDYERFIVVAKQIDGG